MKRSIFLLFYICTLAFPAVSTAQKGTQLTLWGGPQLVSLVNFDDYIEYYNATKLDRKATYRAGGGIDLIYNFAESYGVQSGIFYSQQGQKYSGFIKRDYNTPNDSANKFFTSHIYLNYLRIPLMMRFSSALEGDDRINLTIFGGFQLGLLQDVQEVKTDPAAPDTIMARYPDFDFMQLYKKSDFGLAAGAQFNIKINSTLSTLIGIRYTRSFSTIENTDFDLPKDAPAEWQYPVSTKKSVGGTDNSVRKPTRISAVNVYTGITFMLTKPGSEQ